jgi:tRNA threonylcarbamoyl adenosine modification protein (Sua5/YciO/YrdC/YwlC family)
MAELVSIANPAAIDRALREIRAGNVISFPLENSYVFAADAFNRAAVSELHGLRSDPPGQAASVMIGDKSRIVGIIRDPLAAAEALMECFWPGPLTLYLRPHAALTWDLGDERILDQIAVRVPNVDFATRLLNETGPLAVAGAGLAGRAPFTEPVLIDEVFGRNIDVIIDGGSTATNPDLPAPLTTTVVDCTVNPPRIIRVGAIDQASLRQVWPEISQDLD